MREVTVQYVLLLLWPSCSIQYLKTEGIQRILAKCVNEPLECLFELKLFFNEIGEPQSNFSQCFAHSRVSINTIFVNQLTDMREDRDAVHTGLLSLVLPSSAHPQASHKCQYPPSPSGPQVCLPPCAFRTDLLCFASSLLLIVYPSLCILGRPDGSIALFLCCTLCPWKQAHCPLGFWYLFFLLCSEP